MTAGQSGISGSDIRAIPVPLCSPTEQAIIQDRVDKELSNISKLLSEIDNQLIKSEALRQAILKKAFSGQLLKQDPADEPASVVLDGSKPKRTNEPLTTRTRSQSARKGRPPHEHLTDCFESLKFLHHAAR